jgi:hypothetical protein
MVTPETLNDSDEHGDQFSSHQNRSCIGFGRCATAYTPSRRGVVQSGDSIGISKVDCSQYGMGTVKTAPPGVPGCVGDCEIADLPHWLIVQERQQLLWRIKLFLKMLLLMNGPPLNQILWHIQLSLIISPRYVISLPIRSW